MPIKVLQRLRLKMRIYNLLALLFVFLGLMLFLSMYLDQVEGRFWQAFHSPTFVAIFMIPFLPGVIFWLMSLGLEKKYRQGMKEMLAEKVTAS